MSRTPEERRREQVQAMYGKEGPLLDLLAYFDKHEPLTARVIRYGWNEEAIDAARLDSGVGASTMTVEEFINDGDDA